MTYFSLSPRPKYLDRYIYIYTYIEELIRSIPVYIRSAPRSDPSCARPAGFRALLYTEKRVHKNSKKRWRVCPLFAKGRSNTKHEVFEGVAAKNAGQFA